MWRLGAPARVFCPTRVGSYTLPMGAARHKRQPADSGRQRARAGRWRGPAAVAVVLAALLTALIPAVDKLVDRYPKWDWLWWLYLALIALLVVVGAVAGLSSTTWWLQRQDVRDAAVQAQELAAEEQAKRRHIDAIEFEEH